MNESKLLEVWKKFAGNQANLALESIPSRLSDAQLSQLSPEERNQLMSFKAPERQVEWASGRIALSRVKAAFTKPSSLLTSLSHTSQLYALALGMTSDSLEGVGVDLESDTREIHPRFVDRLIHQREREFDLHLIDFWVIKEACFKADQRNSGHFLSEYEVVSYSELEEGLGGGQVIAPHLKQKIDYQIIRPAGWVVSFAKIVKS